MGTYADLQTVSIGLLLLRVVVGLIMAAHGASKLWGRWAPEVTWIVPTVGIVGGFANPALRRRPVAVST